MYHNPVIRGFNPDPSICYDGRRYLIAVSTFEYFPGVSLYESTDLVSWKFHSAVLTDKELLSLDGIENSRGIYAPTIRFHNGRYYLVTTNKKGLGNFICHTDDLESRWKGPFPVTEIGIDPSLYFLEDGRCYYCSNGEIDGIKGIYGAFINPDTGILQGKLRLLTKGATGYSTEAPHIFRKDGRYYLIYAEGGTEYGHHECVATADNVEGPYKDHLTPILSHTDRKGHPIQATGHADFIQLQDGSWVACFLGIRQPGRAQLHNLGRETFIAPVTWADGLPVIGDRGHVELEMEPFSGTREPLDTLSFSIPIAKQNLLKVRAPKLECYIQDLENGTIRIKGGADISTPLAQPSILLFRQQEFREEFSVTLNTEGLTGKAGLTVFYNSDYHADISVEKHEGRTLISLRRHVHDLEAVTRTIECSKEKIRLEVKADEEKYSFYAAGILLGSAALASFATEATMYMTFTGTLIGIFAEGGEAEFSG